MDKKIAVLATGANGSCISADLTRAGLDVSMIDQWPAHIEAMRANGLTIRMKDEEYNVKVKAYHLCDVCTLNEKFDVVLLTSKAYDLRWLTEFIKPYLADDGLIMAVQNCMTAEMIGEIVGYERTVGCVVELASQLFDPGMVTRSTRPEKTWFAVGAFNPAAQAPARRGGGNSQPGRQVRDLGRSDRGQMDEAPGQFDDHGVEGASRHNQ